MLVASGVVGLVLAVVAPRLGAAEDQPANVGPFSVADAPASLETLADRPWWSPRVPSLDPFPGTTGNSAASCGQCHQAIYQEWQASTHAHAWTDAQFQRELAKDPDVGWICVNCHIPAADQQAELVTWSPEQGVRSVQRQDNPDFDPVLQAEGISCLTCHWRPEGIAAPHEDTQAPHPVVYAPDLLEPDLCLSCHQAAVRLEDALVCHFTTGSEWEAAGRPQPCQGCHMEAVTRAVAPGGPVRETRRHLWPGSLIPKDDAPPEELALFDSWEPGVEARLELPEQAAPGQTVQAVVHLGNVRAGHRVPTGDPERYLWLEAQVAAPDGRGLAGLEVRIGQRWLWWPVATKLDDDRLLPGEERSWELPFVMPDGPAQVEVILDHVRISPENASFHALEGYPTQRRVKTLRGTVAPVVAEAQPTR